ncbi:syndecan-1 isoform X2 [Microcaecilia unicolor]|uniref:Syndecan n=1 Tax=Microcaecilia unicolor TaxID=1415580 RepID=A0A6P7XQ70_9AMPH|nr:syndecan-1 isoform X2 [Microcaecilia unicolor]
MVRIVALSTLVLWFTLAFSNDISNQAPEDQDGSGDDDDASGFGSGAGVILLQDTVTSKREGIETILTTDSPSKYTTVRQSAIEEVQSTSDMVTTSLAKDLEENVLDESEAVQENVLKGLEEVQESNATSEESEMKTSVEMTQVNPTRDTSTISLTNSTNVKDVVHHGKKGEGTLESTTEEDLFENENEFLPAGGVHFSTTMPVAGDTAPTNITDVPEIIEGSGASERDEEFFFVATKESPKQEDKESRFHNVGAYVENGTTDASKGIMERKEVLGGVIAGGLLGLMFAVFLVGFMLYRMKKKDEGSYSLEEPKHSNGGYQKPVKQEEFFA